VRQKIGQNRSQASERRTRVVRGRDEVPANAHDRPSRVARPRGFEPLTFGSVDRRSNAARRRSLHGFFRTLHLRVTSQTTQRRRSPLRPVVDYMGWATDAAATAWAPDCGRGGLRPTTLALRPERVRRGPALGRSHLGRERARAARRRLLAGSRGPGRTSTCFWRAAGTQRSCGRGSPSVSPLVCGGPPPPRAAGCGECAAVCSDRRRDLGRVRATAERSPRETLRKCVLHEQITGPSEAVPTLGTSSLDGSNLGQVQTSRRRRGPWPSAPSPMRPGR
jgi:hypothetical protein